MIHSPELVLNKCSLSSSGTSGAGVASSPPHSDTWEPTKLVPLTPRGCRVMAAASASLGVTCSALKLCITQNRGAPGSMPRPRCPPPLHPPGLGAACSRLGQGRFVQGLGQECGNTVLGARGSAQGPSHRAWAGQGAGLLGQPGGKNKQTSVRGPPALPAPRFPGETRLPGTRQGVLTYSQEGAASAPAARSGGEVLGLPSCLGAAPIPLLPLCLCPLRHLHCLCLCLVSVGAPQTPPPFFTLSTPIFLSV